MAKDITVNQLLKTLDEIAAFDLAEQWDNVGLMVGDPDGLIHGVLVALDPTEEVLAEAKDCGADCIITHHPLIFTPLKTIYTNQPLGRFLRLALVDNIAVIGCHTNLDQAAGGVNDILASGLGIMESVPIVPVLKNQDAEIGSGIAGAGFGRIGRLENTLNPWEFVARLCTYFNLPVLRVAGGIPEEISTVAVCGGSGSDLAETAFAAGAQVYITGEVKHSTARWAEAAGFCIIDAGHFVTENPVVESLAAVLGALLADKNISIPVRQSAKQQNPFAYVQPGHDKFCRKD